MTHDEAQSLCSIIPSSILSREIGMGATCDHGFANALKRIFPEFNWRVYLDRSGEYSHWRLTVNDDEPRERMPEDEVEDDEEMDLLLW